jgi:hypothetical protein
MNCKVTGCMKASYVVGHEGERSLFFQCIVPILSRVSNSQYHEGPGWNKRRKRGRQ